MYQNLCYSIFNLQKLTIHDLITLIELGISKLYSGLESEFREKFGFDIFYSKEKDSKINLLPVAAFILTTDPHSWGYIKISAIYYYTAFS